jgi:outer membrane protein assembly factor BamB
MKLSRLSFFIFTAAFSFAAFAGSDWPQWRGPLRNGIVPNSPPLAGEWPGKGLAKLWDSEEIPSDDDGGHGSVVAAGGRVYAAIVWHTDVPTETRAIDDLVMRQLGYTPTASWPKETVESMEKERLALDPNIKGAALDKVIADWLEKHLDSKKRQTTAGFVRGRFEKRGDAIPLPVYDKLLTISKTRFPNQAAMEKWVNEQDFSDNVKKQIIAAVPPTMKVADDVVVCLDLATGKTLWKCKSPGEAVGRMASSTPCVAGGHVYALGSTHCYAVDANNGKLIWSAPMPGKAPASSPLVADGVFVVNTGKLAAFDAATGKQLWVQPKAGGGNSSPLAWKCGDKTVVICNGRGVMSGVDIKTGDVLWATPAGGDCTPAIVGDSLAAQANNPKIGIFAGKLTVAGFNKLWSYPIDPLRSQSSPLIFDNQVYLMDDNIHYCFDLATGKKLWEEKVPSSTISSPAFADGKIFLLTSGGNKVLMLKPSSEKRIELGKATTRGMWVPSPAIADGKLIVRGRKAITCYDLTAKPPAVAKAAGQ